MIVDHRKPVQVDAEDHDHHQPGEEGRHREPDHRKQRAKLIDPGILPIGRDHPDRDRDQDADHIGHADNPQGERQNFPSR